MECGEYSQAQQPPAINFGQIPEEIMLKIFSYFTTKEISKSLAPVCTEWWTISKDPSLWRRLELNISSEKSPNVYRQLISRWQASLQSLTLTTPALRNEITAYFGNLELLNLRELDLRGRRYVQNCELCNIVSNCPNVEILSLRLGVSSGLDNISILKNLKSLTISENVFQQVLSPDLEQIFEMCTKLEALILRILDSFDEEFYVHLAKHRKETLKHLFLYRNFLTNNGIRAITSCHNLSTLCLKRIGSPLRSDMLRTLSTMRNLKWLGLGGAMTTEPEAWSDFFKSPNLSSLTILELSGSDLDDNGLFSLAMTCKKLVILDLSHNYELQNAGVQHVVDNCRELYYLDLAGTQVTILIYIPTKLPKLKYLNVQLCRGIDERDLKKFTLMCPRIEFTNDDTHVEYTVDKRLNLKWES